MIHSTIPRVGSGAGSQVEALAIGGCQTRALWRHDDAAARELAQHLVDEKLLPLLVNNLYQFAAMADDVEKDGQKTETAVLYYSLQILENLVDLEPQVCADVV
uniref:Beta-catenin-like protein 1 N-terminal domain-containing protein n=1 Tax=Peronospora matthiolae TaxID=2874970 RepID=A0AAV1UQW9_9STRA